MTDFCFVPFCKLVLGIRKSRRNEKERAIVWTFLLASQSGACGGRASDVGLAHGRTLKMPIFECKVSRAVFTDDLKVTRLKENVYVEAKDEIEAKKKAGHPQNWFKSSATFGKSDRSSFLLTIEECRRVTNDEVKALSNSHPISSGSR